MTKIITIANQKGGVGKTTTAQALTAGLAQKGRATLAIDLDAQMNLTYSMGLDRCALTSLEVLTKTATAQEAIRKTSQGDLLPAGPSLATADLLLTELGKEYRLKEAIRPILSNYDYIVIDCPPALNILTINALTASNSVIIPAQADAYSLQGIGQLAKSVHLVNQYCNDALKIEGILITRFSPRTVIAKDMAEMLKATAKDLHTFLYHAKIRECTALKEASASRQSIFTYAKNSNASKDYHAFIDEFLERCE